jgi:MFS family permease
MNIIAATKEKFALPALTVPGFKWLWGNFLFSFIATNMQLVAVGWLVYKQTASSTLLGIAISMKWLPLLLFSLFFGAVTDQFNRRTIVILSLIAALSINIAYATMIYNQSSTIWLIILLNFLHGMVSALSTPARKAIIPSLMPTRHIMNATVLTNLAQNLAQILGPTLAGFAIDHLGFCGCFLIQAGLYLLACLQLLFVPDQPSLSEKKSIIRNAWEGLCYAIRRREILSLLLYLATVGTFCIASFQVVMPVFSKHILASSAKGFGLIMSAFGCGALLGSLILASLGNMKQKGRVFLYTMFIGTGTIFVFSFCQNVSQAMLIIFLFGIIAAFFNNLALTILQLVSPDCLRGRLLGLYHLSYMGAGLLGNLIMGGLADLFGPQRAFMIGCSLTALFLMLIFGYYPAIRELE